MFICQNPGVQGYLFIGINFHQGFNLPSGYLRIGSAHQQVMAIFRTTMVMDFQDRSRRQEPPQPGCQSGRAHRKYPLRRRKDQSSNPIEVFAALFKRLDTPVDHDVELREVSLEAVYPGVIEGRYLPVFFW